MRAQTAARDTPGDEHIDYIDDQEPTARLRALLAPQAIWVREAAALGDSAAALAALDEHRLLCAHREGPRGSGTGTARSNTG